MYFSLDRLKGLIQICVSMHVTSLNCTEQTQCVPVLEWLKTGNELGVYINTPGIQKHVTVLNTRNGDILRSGNIKGGMF